MADLEDIVRSLLIQAAQPFVADGAKERLKNNFAISSFPVPPRLRFEQEVTEETEYGISVFSV